MPYYICQESRPVIHFIPVVTMSSRITTGRVLLSLVALITIFGPYIADWNHTHVLNPNWPPHAKFHNGQTMSMGLSLGLATLYCLYRPSPALTEDSLRTACFLSIIYYVTLLSAILYPGTKFIDPEFGEGHPQAYMCLVMFALVGLGYWLESRRLARDVKLATS